MSEKNNWFDFYLKILNVAIMSMFYYYKYTVYRKKIINEKYFQFLIYISISRTSGNKGIGINISSSNSIAVVVFVVVI